MVVKEEEEEDVVTTGWFGWSGEEEGRGGSHLRSLSLSLFRRRRVCIRSSCLHCRERKVAESPLGGGNKIQACIGGGGGGGEDASLSLFGVETIRSLIDWEGRRSRHFATIIRMGNVEQMRMK